MAQRQQPKAAAPSPRRAAVRGRSGRRQRKRRMRVRPKSGQSLRRRSWRRLAGCVLVQLNPNDCNWMNHPVRHASKSNRAARTRVAGRALDSNVPQTDCRMAVRVVPQHGSLLLRILSCPFEFPLSFQETGSCCPFEFPLSFQETGSFCLFKLESLSTVVACAGRSIHGRWPGLRLG